MIIEKLELGPYASNCYLVADETTREAIIIDPGDGADHILGRIGQLELTVKYIVLTHGHPDHIGAVKAVKEATGAELLIHPEDTVFLQGRPGAGGMFHQPGPPPDVDREIRDGDIVSVGDVSLKVMHTPGHTLGGICLLTDGILFSGDTLFLSSIGRSDFPGGNGPQLLQSIHTRLLTLPDETIVYPGHGPATTIGDERRFNPFLQKM